jgi:hypothetical protein
VLTIRLVWEMQEPMQGRPTVFVHIVDAAGGIAAQADGDPLAGLYPLNRWHGNTIITDIRYARLPDRTGPYTVYDGVWDPSTGEKLMPAGGEYPDGRIPVGTVGP